MVIFRGGHQPAQPMKPIPHDFLQFGLGWWNIRIGLGCEISNPIFNPTQPNCKCVCVCTILIFYIKIRKTKYKYKRIRKPLTTATTFSIIVTLKQIPLVQKIATHT